MKPRPFVAPFIAGLLVFAILAIACGEDGGGNDEDAIDHAVQEVTAAANDRDFDTLAELSTDNFETTPAFQTLMDDPGFRRVDLDIISVEVIGDQATVVADFNGQTVRDELSFSRVDGRWLLDNIVPLSQRSNLRTRPPGP